MVVNVAAVRQFRAKELAILLSISEREIWRLVARGELARPVKIGRCALWFESDVSDLQSRLRGQRGGPTV